MSTGLGSLDSRSSVSLLSLSAILTFYDLDAQRKANLVLMWTGSWTAAVPAQA